jgi:PST family polysaccharide transporter
MDSLPIFLSNVSIKLYVSTNKVILGAFCSMSEVAYYDLGEKITSVLKIPQALLTQTVFPKINKEKDIKFVKKLFPFSLSINVFLFIVILFVSKPIVLILGGQKMFAAVWIVNILAMSVPIIAMSNIFGIQVLIPFGETKKFSRVIISSGFVYLVQLFLIWLFLGINIYSVSIITVTTEVFVTAYMFYFCKKYHLWQNHSIIL